MRVIYKNVLAKSILSKSRIPNVDYCVNPYVGCLHACRYCYATFMKRFTDHGEPWGSFVDIKTNAPELLERQLKKARRGRVMLSSVTDAYQPVESKTGLTRRCLEILLAHRFPVNILTKSPLVLRDLDLIAKFRDIDVGLTITTDEDRVRKAFEPKAPPIEARVRALRELSEKGVRTFVFIGPVLPMNPKALARKLRGHVSYIFVDRMNYASKTRGIYRKLGLEKWLEPGFVDDVAATLEDEIE
jgi:DNA repair photolyase